MTKDFDLLIIGSGPGGYIAAIRASQLKMKVGIIESAPSLGGICLNWGCIPTKALLKSAEYIQSIDQSKIFGVDLQGTFDIKKIVSHSRGVSETLSKGVSYLMKKNKITVIHGIGSISKKSSDGRDGWMVDVQLKDGKNQTYGCDNVIIATGARARLFPGVSKHERIWTYKNALVPKTLPKTMTIIGSGAIGMEFADFYNTLGVKVNVLEAKPQILPTEDKDIAKLAYDAFIKKGVKFLYPVQVEGINPSDHKVKITYKDSKDQTHDMESDVVLLAIGIVGNTENLGLEHTQVQIERTHILVDSYSKTHSKGIFAIGDVASTTPWLAHKASHEGIICVEKIAGLHPHPLNPLNVPGCFYTHPQIASVGYTEQAAKKAGYTIQVGKFPLIGNGKAIILHEEGMVKTIIDKNTGELLGAHMIGPEVTELIQGYVIGKSMEGVAEDFTQAIFPHPSISESMPQSILEGYGLALDI